MPQGGAPLGQRWQWKQSSGLEAFTSAWDGGGDAQVGFGAEAQKGVPPGEAPTEVGNLGVVQTRTVCGDSRAPAPSQVPPELCVTGGGEREGTWTPGVVMNPRGSWTTWALPMMGKEPRTSIAKAGDAKLRTNMSVGFATSWLAPRSEVEVQCHGSGPCPGLLCWTFWPDATVLGEGAGSTPGDNCGQRRVLWEKPQLWSQLGLVQN